MRPIHFNRVTETYAKNQPEYGVLPVSKQRTDKLGVFEFTSKHELSDLEIEQIVKTRCIYNTQLGNCLHPASMSVQSPFGFCAIEFKMTSQTTYNFFIPMADKTTFELTCELSEAMDKLVDITKLNTEQLAFFERPVLGIDASGNIVGI